MGSKSFDMSCSIVKLENGVEVELAKGLAIIVCFNYKTKYREILVCCIFFHVELENSASKANL